MSTCTKLAYLFAAKEFILHLNKPESTRIITENNYFYSLPIKLTYLSGSYFKLKIKWHQRTDISEKIKGNYLVMLKFEGHFVRSSRTQKTPKSYMNKCVNNSILTHFIKELFLTRISRSPGAVACRSIAMSTPL